MYDFDGISVSAGQRDGPSRRMGGWRPVSAPRGVHRADIHLSSTTALTTYLARIRSEVNEVHDAGDSRLVLARVQHVVHGDGDPLVHHSGGYAALAPFDRYILQAA